MRFNPYFEGSLSMSTLILGYPLDIHLHAVHWALNELSVPNRILYASDFPYALRSSLRFSGSKPPRAEFRNGSSSGASGEFETVWFRRAGRTLRPLNMADADWTIAQRECDHYMSSLRYHLAPSALWVNDIDAREKSRLKPMQLEVAKEAGLRIPETLFSNDPDEIRRFFAECRASGAVFKLSDQANWHTSSPAERYSLFTTEIGEDHLRDDLALSNCQRNGPISVGRNARARVSASASLRYAAGREEPHEDIPARRQRCNQLPGFSAIGSMGAGPLDRRRTYELRPLRDRHRGLRLRIRRCVCDIFRTGGIIYRPALFTRMQV